MLTTEELQEIIQNLQRNLRDTTIEYWTLYVFNTWQWWVNIAALIIPILVWMKLVDRKRLMEILIYGFFVSSAAVFLDVIGETMVLWDYPYLIIPVDYILLDTDYAAMPVIYMLVYQYFLSWKKFIIASAVVAGIFAFVAEPLLIALGLYEVHGWRFLYSFPIYMGIAIICRWITHKIVEIQRKSVL